MRENHIKARMERIAAHALLAEVETTPKPGLVDLHDTGAHRDMNYTTFVKSTAAIAPYLGEMAATGYRLAATCSPDALFSAIRAIGIEAEQAMFEATGGVNTHKGILFSMGILCAAAGRRLGLGQTIPVLHLLEDCGHMTHDSLERDFLSIDRSAPKTHGEKLFVQYGEKGIRGEAAQGFPSVREVAYPFYSRQLKRRISQNEARVNTLLCLMTVVTDTNVLTRSGPAALSYVRETAKEILTAGGASHRVARQALEQLNLDYIRRNVSPGGCADLLAVTVFLHELSLTLPQCFPADGGVIDGENPTMVSHIVAESDLLDLALLRDGTAVGD